MFLNGEFAGTTTMWCSSVSRAIGTTSSNVTVESFVAMAPTNVAPVTIRLFGSVLVTNCERPIVPPAPAMLITSAPLGARLSVSIAACNARAVLSHPPPGAAGAMSCTAAVGKSPLAASGDDPGFC